MLAGSITNGSVNSFVRDFTKKLFPENVAFVAK